MVFSFHLARLNPAVSASALLKPPTPQRTQGLRFAESMVAMRLGAPVVSAGRFQLHRLALFAGWRDQAALDSFLREDPLGRRLTTGWHVRLEFLRRWGQVAAFGDLPEIAGRSDPNEPVVAVTVARMRLPEVPRFIHWGRPVERQVRDDPATTFAMAAIRPPRTVSTFSVWRTARAMTDMVHGRSHTDAPHRHAAAMRERERRDFHHEFTTLRFRPISEHGTWEQRSAIVPAPSQD